MTFTKRGVAVCKRAEVESCKQTDQYGESAAAQDSEQLKQNQKNGDEEQRTRKRWSPHELYSDGRMETQYVDDQENHNASDRQQHEGQLAASGSKKCFLLLESRQPQSGQYCYPEAAHQNKTFILEHAQARVGNKPRERRYAVRHCKCQDRHRDEESDVSS